MSGDWGRRFEVMESGFWVAWGKLQVSHAKPCASILPPHVCAIHIPIYGGDGGDTCMHPSHLTLVGHVHKQASKQTCSLECREDMFDVQGSFGMSCRARRELETRYGHPRPTVGIGMHQRSIFMLLSCKCLASRTILSFLATWLLFCLDRRDAPFELVY